MMEVRATHFLFCERAQLASFPWYSLACWVVCRSCCDADPFGAFITPKVCLASSGDLFSRIILPLLSQYVRKSGSVGVKLS
jgi:hypothetical protein